MKIWIDGSGALLPGQKARACVVFEDGTRLIRELEQGTNNEMEYRALLLALADERASGSTILTDSQLLVGQLTRNWKVKAGNLKPLNGPARVLMAQRGVRLVWIPRGQNKAGKILEKLLKE